MSDENDGATPRERLLEACRRNNTDLLTDLLRNTKPINTSSATIAHFLNSTADALGASALHVAAQYGSYDVLDLILDQEGVEIDGRETRDGDTCLHKAVRYCNAQPTQHDREAGKAVVEILLDAGCDPRIRNKAKLKPLELVDAHNKDLRTVLQKAEIAMMAGDDIVNEDDDSRDGPGSESD